MSYQLVICIKDWGRYLPKIDVKEGEICLITNCDAKEVLFTTESAFKEATQFIFSFVWAEKTRIFIKHFRLLSNDENNIKDILE